MRLFFDTFSTGQTVNATGTSNATLQSWLKRGVVIGTDKDPVTGAGSPGVHRRFTFRSVMEIAVAKVILDTSAISVREAFYAAGMFAHTGDVEPIARIPGLPYKGGVLTLIRVAGDHSEIVPYQPGQDAYPLIRGFQGSPEGISLIWANPVFDRVAKSLGYEPQDILAEAYFRRDGANG